MPCSCRPDAVPSWQVMFLGRLEARSEPALRCLTYTDEEVAALSADALPVYRGYDVVMGGHLLAVIDANEKNADAALVRATIADREAEQPGTVARSGRAVWSIINEVITPTHGSELDDLEKRLEKPVFSMQQSAVAVKLAAGRFKTLRGQLPEGSRGGERELLKAFLKKFPPELTVHAARFRRKMNECEVRKKPYSWSYEELTAILASLIADGTDREANSTDVQPPGGGGGGAIGTFAFKGCLNCGLDNHHSRKCTTTPCAYCGLRFCFGARKRGPKPGCLVKKLIEGGSVGKSDVGLNNRPLGSHLIAQLKEKAEALKAEKETNTAGVQTVATPDDDDDDDDGAYESELCELDVCC